MRSIDMKTSEAEGSPQPAKKARIDSGTCSSVIVALEELVATKGLPAPKYKYSDAYSVRCTVRDHTFEAVCKFFSWRSYSFLIIHPFKCLLIGRLLFQTALRLMLRILQHSKLWSSCGEGSCQFRIQP